MKLPITNTKGERLGEFDLDEGLLVFDKGQQAMKDYIVAYRAHQRAGTASTRDRSEVAGGGAKPWKQKGLGRARVGSRNSPIWRGGGVVFGPRPRSYDQRVTKKSARLAFRRSFSDKVAAGGVEIIDELSLAEPKTRLFAELLANLNIPYGALFVVDKVDRNIQLAARNIPDIHVTTAERVNAYELLRYPRVVISKAAMPILQERLTRPVRRKKA